MEFLRKDFWVVGQPPLSQSYNLPHSDRAHARATTNVLRQGGGLETNPDQTELLSRDGVRTYSLVLTPPPSKHSLRLTSYTIDMTIDHSNIDHSAQLRWLSVSLRLACKHSIER
jgi:hypothetical protein